MSLKIRIKSKELPLLNNRKPRIKLIVRTRQLAKKPSAHSQKVEAHCRTKVNLGTDGSTVNNYKVQLGDDMS